MTVPAMCGISFNKLVEKILLWIGGLVGFATGNDFGMTSDWIPAFAGMTALPTTTLRPSRLCAFALGF
jgi:hypothetical protein